MGTAISQWEQLSLTHRTSTAGGSMVLLSSGSDLVGRQQLEEKIRRNKDNVLGHGLGELAGR